MAIEITTQNVGAPIPSPQYVLSPLKISHPTDIRLTQSNAAVQSYDKVGADLIVTFADGETLIATNFFVIGETGDFSRLVAADGEVLVTGLLAPEPNDTLSPTESFAPIDAGEPGGSSMQAVTQETGNFGGAWAKPALFAGLGFSSGTVLFANNDEATSASPVASTTTSQDEALDTEALSTDAEPVAVTPIEGATEEAELAAEVDRFVGAPDASSDDMAYFYDDASQAGGSASPSDRGAFAEMRASDDEGDAAAFKSTQEDAEDFGASQRSPDDLVPVTTSEPDYFGAQTTDLSGAHVMNAHGIADHTVLTLAAPSDLLSEFILESDL
ncbi:hypothetical protein [Albirhodobacter sp. R86504]|uniref:BapA/Bap/LapF family prefix-like domain-containing protein n=1 Tax=Albirhodobacter sp. R86504 TaxID=3093848 RepID=UPI00366ABA69